MLYPHSYTFGRVIHEDQVRAWQAPLQSNECRRTFLDLMREDAFLQAEDLTRTYNSPVLLNLKHWKMPIHWLGNGFVRLGQWLQGWQIDERRNTDASSPTHL